jgi:hypothetical protein
MDKVQLRHHYQREGTFLQPRKKRYINNKSNYIIPPNLKKEIIMSVQSCTKNCVTQNIETSNFFPKVKDKLLHTAELVKKVAKLALALLVAIPVATAVLAIGTIGAVVALTVASVGAVIALPILFIGALFGNKSFEKTLDGKFEFKSITNKTFQNSILNK